MSTKIIALDLANYRKHMIHGEGRDWSETNCYVDLWIELLYSMGYEPIAALPCVFGIDFEGDQWTFFKFSLADLDRLYGLDVQELNIWKELLSCIEEQVALMRPVLVELDSYFLPDTAGTAYKLDHVKTTVAVNHVDRDKRYMEYFHNQGYFSLEGDDFTALFLDELDSRVLPPYVEYVKARNRSPLTTEELVSESIHIFTYQLENLPRQNPFTAFSERFEKDFSDLGAFDIDYFHKYSFATLRQYGAAFELCKTYLTWLAEYHAHKTKLLQAADVYGKISESAKVLQFQLARAIARKKPLNLDLLNDSANHWQQARDIVTEVFL